MTVDEILRNLRNPVAYECSGINEHGKRCGKLLLVWKPPAVNGAVHDTGVVEVKCRRCKTMNHIRFSDAVSTRARTGAPAH